MSIQIRSDAILGHGFVVRAVDNSNVVPRKLVDKLVTLSRANGATVQYGVTGGGNDGSAFLVYGSTDVALGWPLRYSHSPAEVIDISWIRWLRPSPPWPKAGRKTRSYLGFRLIIGDQASHARSSV